MRISGRYDAWRNVVCVAGVPFDVVSLDEAISHVCSAIVMRGHLFLSTPNLNFLIAAQQDAAFRDSVVHSDLSIADGMPIVWLSRLLGLPIKERVAGSTLFEKLRAGEGWMILGRPISVYFFGGPHGVAEIAAERINADPRYMRCVGFCCPGFGDIEAMSDARLIDEINASGADFLVVALGAKKGQAWIERNRARINVPVISHLGAVVNFVAGTVRRAPPWMQRMGLEWVWRIKEEPALLARYWQDAKALVGLLVGKILPLVLARNPYQAEQGNVSLSVRDGVTFNRFVGGLDEVLLEQWLRSWRGFLAPVGASVVLDLSQVNGVTPLFFGAVLRYRHYLELRNSRLSIHTGRNALARKLCHGYGLTYLLEPAR